MGMTLFTYQLSLDSVLSVQNKAAHSVPPQRGQEQDTGRRRNRAIGRAGFRRPSSYKQLSLPASFSPAFPRAPWCLPIRISASPRLPGWRGSSPLRHTQRPLCFLQGISSGVIASCTPYRCSGSLRGKKSPEPIILNRLQTPLKLNCWFLLMTKSRITSQVVSQVVHMLLL